MPFPETRTVNAVLTTIAPGWELARSVRGSLYLVANRQPTSAEHLLRVRLRSSDRLWLVRSRAFAPWGGTTEQAICQLVLWQRDLPRRPLAWWRHCCSPQVGLGTAQTLKLLSDAEPGGYADPERVGCVLCGAADPSDWWALDDVIGPCCFAGRCRKGMGE